MDAWESLLAGSTITDGDAWEHLQAQGGGGENQIVYVTGGLEATMENTLMSATIHTGELQATLVDIGDLSATGQEIILTGTIKDADLTGTITKSELSGVIE